MKVALLVVLCVCTIALGRRIPFFNTRIVGGVETTIERHPYQVSVDVWNQHICGGTILNENTILTAAHCAGYSAQDYDVKVGATIHSQGQSYPVSQVIKHEGYDPNIINNDLAIIKLARPLTFSNKVQPIPYQPANTPVPAGTKAGISGWGATYWGDPVTPDVLREVEVDVISNAECQSIYANYGLQITDAMLCILTRGKGSCQGDSGGPLVANGKVIGAVSWAIGCAEDNIPTVFANVSNMNDFIVRHL